MSELSPAAQEVFWAFNKAASGEPYDWHYLPAVAAALRAAADQVVPTPHFPYDSCCDVNASAIRAELVAIAAELEVQ